MIREAVDDIRRWRRDQEVNGQVYRKLVSPTAIAKKKDNRSGEGGTTAVTSANIKVGDLVFVEKVRLCWQLALSCTNIVFI